MPIAIIPLLLKVLPTILSLIDKGLSLAHDQQMIGLGEAKVMNETAARISDTLAKAKAASETADAAQAMHPDDDGGFDQSFQRKD